MAARRRKALTNRERATYYHKTFPDFPVPRYDERWLDASWIIGNSYGGSGYYGSYPNGYLARILSMFPDCKDVLHLFSGGLVKAELEKAFPHFNHTRFDRCEDVLPDVCGEAVELLQHFPKKSFDLICADPPYTGEDAEHYGTTLVKRNSVLRDARDLLRPGGTIVWLDQMMPMFSKKLLHWWGAFGIHGSTNHRFRSAVFFRRVG